ncbi:hypothetical protein [Bosea sp. (in: a-proteobacteria)]|uniref:hypothetical protein n=1 Tax=Bosea sp. (in: a-proteobacteria) TaxID=1871050 RepID=UPI003B3B0D27
MDTLSTGASSAMPGQFRVGSVLSKTFAVFSRRFGKFFLLALVPLLPVLLLIVLAIAASSANSSAVAFMAGLAGILAFILQIVAQATSLYGAFQEMRQRPFTIGESLRVGLSRALPVLGVGILAGLAIIIGFLLLVVPGVIIACMLFAAAPACIIERLGVMASLKRSRALTKGYRWQIFGLFLLLIVVTGVGSFVLSRIGAGGVAAELLNFIWQVVSTAFGAVMSAVIYHDLRVAKEGIDGDTLTSVFD